MPPQLQQILNLLESFRSKSQVQSFLEEKGIPSTGTWARVRRRIDRGVGAGTIALPELVSLLEEIEEHGNQYAYLYDLDPKKAAGILDRESLVKLLTADERRKVLDQTTIIENPSDKPVLVSAKFLDQHLKLKWIQKRSYRRPIGESSSGNIVTVRYEIVPTRAVDLALFDLKRATAYLFVQKIEPSLRDYRAQHSALVSRLERFLKRDGLVPLDLGRLMKRLSDEKFDEARRRRHQARDTSGAIVDVTSATETDDVFESGFYRAGRENYSGPLSDLQVNVYWRPVAGRLEEEVHTIFPYRQSVNGVIFTQRCSRGERDYVLSRIDAIARGKP